MVPRGEEYKEVLSFDQTMGAVMSNAKAGDFDVIERRNTWGKFAVPSLRGVSKTKNPPSLP